MSQNEQLRPGNCEESVFMKQWVLFFLDQSQYLLLYDAHTFPKDDATADTNLTGVAEDSRHRVRTFWLSTQVLVVVYSKYWEPACGHILLAYYQIWKREPLRAALDTKNFRNQHHEFLIELYNRGLHLQSKSYPNGMPLNL